MTWRMNSNSASASIGPLAWTAVAEIGLATEALIGKLGWNDAARKRVVVDYCSLLRYPSTFPRACRPPSSSTVGRSRQSHTRDVSADQLVDIEQHHHASRYRGQTFDEFRA